MGVLCSCGQAIIYVKERQEVELNPKVPNQKNISHQNASLKTKYREKHLTKDSTLLNNSNNNNSQDYHESNKHNLTEIEHHKNNLNDKEFTKIKNIPNKEIIDKEVNKKVNTNDVNNIHLINPSLGSLSPDSKMNKKNDKFLNLNHNYIQNPGGGGGGSGEKKLIGFRADSFNCVENPIKTALSKKSNNLTKSEHKKLFISNKTVDGMNKQEEKNFKLSYSIKPNAIFGQESQKLLRYYLHKHFMILDYNDDFINYLIDYVNILNYNNKEIIFKKGETANNFYIIKQGTVLLLSNGKVHKKLSTGHTFGEISLFQNQIPENNNDNNDINESVNNGKKLVRNYTAISNGKTELFVIKGSSYNIALKAFSSKIKTIDYSEDQNELKMQYRSIIDNYKFFKYLDNSKRDLIVKMSKIFSFKENGLLLSKSNYNKRVISTLIGNKPFFRSKQNLIFPIQGELMELSENLVYRKKIKKNSSSGIVHILCPKMKTQLYTKTSQEDTKVIYIAEEILIEVLGPNYPREILKQYFYHLFLQQKILSIFLNINNDIIDVNKLNEKDKMKIFETFNVFTVKGYEQSEIIYHHQNAIDNKKIIIPIINNLLIYNSEIKKNEIIQGNILIEEIFNDYNEDFNIRSENSWTIVLETKWRNIYDHFNSMKNEYEDIIKRFNIYKDMICLRPLYSLTIKQLIDFGENTIIKEYKPRELIIKNQEKNDLFFLILKGRVKVKNPETNKTLRVYEEGNCFGCYNILNESASTRDYISHEYTKCYCLNSKKFYEFLKIIPFNDYIRKKMLLEDEEMQLSDFYYLSYLGKGTFGYVCLVHNELSFYAIKAINRDAAEQGKNGVKNLVNERKCMIAIDHPFIVNFVKTMKNRKWVFILEEYVKGKNFDNYLSNRKNYKNIKELVFYGGCLFHMLKYLTKRRICHRDIKPRNIMIGTDGYLKLLDFGCARKIKLFTNTIVGTPNYISPEVLKGRDYSFACDYWSVGVCCYLIYFGKLPFGDKSTNIMQIYNEITKAEINIPKDCPLVVKELIEGLLKKNMGERINNFEKVKQCQIFKDFDWENLLRKKLEPFYMCEGDNLGGKANLKNLASPFDKFIQNEWVETTEMHLLKIKNKEKNENMQEQFENDYINNQEDGSNINYEINEEFSNNWFEFF